MKHRGWFTLLVRALGLILVAYSVPEVVSQIVTFVELRSRDGGQPLPQPFRSLAWASFAARALQLVLGAYLLFGGRWFIERCLREAERVERQASPAPTDSTST